MHYKDRVGITNKFDPAIWDGHPTTNDDHINTIPFMAGSLKVFITMVKSSGANVGDCFSEV